MDRYCCNAIKTVCRKLNVNYDPVLTEFRDLFFFKGRDKLEERQRTFRAPDQGWWGRPDGDGNQERRLLALAFAENAFKGKTLDTYVSAS